MYLNAKRTQHHGAQNHTYITKQSTAKFEMVTAIPTLASQLSQ